MTFTATVGLFHNRKAAFHVDGLSHGLNHRTRVEHGFHCISNFLRRDFTFRLDQESQVDLFDAIRHRRIASHISHDFDVIVPDGVTRNV